MLRQPRPRLTPSAPSLQRLRYIPSYDRIFEVDTIQDSAIDELDYVELGLLCADICGTLDRGTKGKKPDDLSRSVYEAINRLTKLVKSMTHSLGSSLTTVDRRTSAEIQRKVIEQRGGNAVSQNGKDAIAAWRLDLNGTLDALNVRSVVSA